MTVLYFVAKSAKLGFKRRDSTGFKTFYSGMCEKREEKTSLIFVDSDIGLSGLSFTTESAVKIECVCQRAGRKIARRQRASKPC